jgi:ATP-binding cassette subfamily B multidrug efflux pump
MFKLFKNFSKKDMGLIVISISLIVVQVWLELKMPDYMTEITKLVQTKGSSMNDILVQGGYMLLCAGGSLVSAIIVGYLASLLSATFSKNIRSKIFNKVQSFTMEEINKFSTSSLITRTTNDITQVEMFIAMGLQMLIKSPIMAIWAIMKILGKGWQWSVATGVAVFVLLLVITILILVVLPKFKIVQKLIDNINELARENLKGIRVVRAFNAEEYQENKFAEGNKKLTETQLFTQRMMAVMKPTINLVMHGLTLSIYFIGAYLINEANMMDKITLFSNMVVFSSYSMQVIMSFLMLALIFIMYPRTSVAADRINEVLDTESKIKDGDVTSARSNVKVEFKNVSFKYPDADEYILKDISFKVNLGETVAFIGSTGSGKSTLINLVMRFYDVTDGEILVDGVNIKDYNLEYLYNKLGYVPQRAVIFNDSIKNNVSYGDNGNDISDTKVKEAIKVAQASEFVNEMPKKENSNIASGGTNISGGQKQRLAIARAIARNPEIYIFDDAFSALDYKTDHVLRSELKKYTKDATNLIVAQRIGTILDADKIVVLDQGKCVGIGTHKELMKNCEVYKEIAYSQLSKEELENA